MVTFPLTLFSFISNFKLLPVYELYVVYERRFRFSGSEVGQLLVEELQRDRERLQAQVAELQGRCPVKDFHEQGLHIQDLKV